MKFTDEKTMEAIGKLKEMLESEDLSAKDTSKTNDSNIERNHAEAEALVACFNETVNLLADVTDILDDIRVLLQTSNIHEEEDISGEETEEEDLPGDDHLAMLIRQPDDRCRLISLEDVFLSCNHKFGESALLKIPETKDLYFLCEKYEPVKIKDKDYMFYPIVIVKVDENDDIITPDEVDRFCVRRIINEKTEFLKGSKYDVFPAFCLT